MNSASTTGRPRRCGWLDMVVLKTAIRLNGLSGLVITKLDVLTGIPVLKVATAYRCGSDLQETLPSGTVRPGSLSARVRGAPRVG